jgi:predicted metal-dependent HD superfamily phosphohydrolase
MQWSKIDEDSDDYYPALLWYDENLAYHNMNHIQECYEFLNAANAPYDADLDYAILFHDIIYDKDPLKEERSADFVLERFPEQTKSAEIILATAHHKITPDMDEPTRWMIRADLHGLASTHTTVINYSKIMEESMYLYDVSAKTFAEKNLDFMLKLLETAINNSFYDSDEHLQFWIDVSSGINLTINLSTAIRNNK